MKAIGYIKSHPIDHADALVDITVQKPTATGRDILVKVEAVSVNPVDTKIRFNRADPTGAHSILGWDAYGVVAQTGADVTMFKAGDKVFYAGAIDRSGTNAEFHLVDERIAGAAPTSTTSAQAAAMPLTSLTAYEMLFDRLRVTDPVAAAANAILIIGGAGGVGSIAIQLLAAKTDLTIIATASRPETMAWAKSLGAHHVIDHSQPIAAQVAALGLGQPAFVFSTTHTGSYVDDIAALIAPQGRFGLIDDPSDLSIMPFKQKSVSIHWEFMYTRSLFQTADMTRQHDILSEIATLLDTGKIKSTATESLGTINATNLKTAHALLESGKAKGKLTLSGF